MTVLREVRTRSLGVLVGIEERITVSSSKFTGNHWGRVLHEREGTMVEPLKLINREITP